MASGQPQRPAPCIWPAPLRARRPSLRRTLSGLAGTLTCAVIVPFLNEERYLPAFLKSVDGQRRRPQALVLVDDGSTDGSADAARAFAAERDWVTYERRPPRELRGDRLVGAPELAAFLWAYERLGDAHDVVAKMDADLRLAPDHVGRVMAAFEADPGLGMAGTYLYSDDGTGRLRRERHPAHHVRGPTRFYRRRCLADISPLPVMLGWDGGDEVRARARGWRTRSVEPAAGQSVHLRPTGAHDGRLRAYRRWGLCAYAVGAHPLAVAAGAAARLRDRPPVLGSLAYLWGFVAARLRHAPRLPEDIRRAKRREHARELRSLARRPRQAAAAGLEQQVGVAREEAPGAANVLDERPPEH
jgi:biofilm PGA synthesis N-glycosyltransferase PgaC